MDDLGQMRAQAGLGASEFCLDRQAVSVLVSQSQFELFTFLPCYLETTILQSIATLASMDAMGAKAGKLEYGRFDLKGD